MGEGDPGASGAGFSMGSCRFCARVRLGRICRSATERIKRCNLHGYMQAQPYSTAT